MIGVGWVEPRVLYGGGYPGDGEAGAVGLDMEAAVGYDGCREGVEALSERYMHACVEEPAGEGGGAAESVDYSWLCGADGAVGGEQFGPCAHAVHYEGLAEAFGQQGVQAQQFCLAGEWGASEPVEAAFADGCYARVGGGFFHERPQCAGFGAAPGMDSGAECALGRQGCVGLDVDDGARACMEVVCVDVAYCHVRARGRSRFRPMDGSVRAV